VVRVEAGSFSLSFPEMLKPGIYLMVGNNNALRYRKRIVVE